MSTTERFRREQNRLSVFLAQVRHILPRVRWECLLSMRRESHRSRPSRLDPAFEEAWLEAFSEALDQAFRALEKGNPGRSGYLRIGHLYRDYFFALYGRAAAASVGKRSIR